MEHASVQQIRAAIESAHTILVGVLQDGATYESVTASLGPTNYSVVAVSRAADADNEPPVGYYIVNGPLKPGHVPLLTTITPGVIVMYAEAVGGLRLMGDDAMGDLLESIVFPNTDATRKVLN